MIAFFRLPNGLAQRRADLVRLAGGGAVIFGRIPSGGRSPARPTGDTFCQGQVYPNGIVN
jgi:hypothetical protein